MAYAIWPSGMPQHIQTQGFNEKLPTNTLKSTMDYGPDKVRRKDVAAVTELQCQQILTREQRSTLILFFRDTLHDGARAFDWVHPVTRTPCEMRFTEAPSITPLGNTFFSASYKLEVLP